MNQKIVWVISMVFLLTLNGYSQTLKGKITNPQFKAVENATVRLLNTNREVISDASGSFEINLLEKGSYILEISAIGFATLQQEIKLSTNLLEVTIALKEASLQLDAVYVTAQKKDEPIQKIPITVSALHSGQIKNFRLWSVQDLTAIAPNLIAENPGDGRNITSIRGIVNTSYDPSVATYIDGVNQFSLDTYIDNLSNVERIEVLRGPQGTLYGRNAMGGVINIITKQPGNNREGSLEVNLGNYGQQRHLASFRSPLVKNKLFVGIAGMFDKRNGFYTNTYNQSSFDQQQGWNGSGFLKWIPKQDWTVQLNWKFQNNVNNGAFPLVNGVAEALTNPFNLEQNAVAAMHDKTSNTSLQLQHFGNKVQFNSISAWQQNQRIYDAPLDGDFSPADAVTILNDFGKEWNKVSVYTQEFRWNNTASKISRVNWTAGSYLFLQKNPAKQATHFGKDAGLLGAPMTDFSTINTTRGKNYGIAFFGQANYALTEKLNIIAGLRIDQESKQLSVKGEFQPDGSSAFETQSDTTANASFTALSPKLGLNLALTENNNLYLSYTRGYRTGGFTQLSSDPSQPPLYPFNPEFSDNLELGIKNTWLQNKLRLNVTLFSTIATQVQVPTLVLPDAITITRNTGKLKSKGVEVEIYTTPLKGLQLDYTLGITNASYSALSISQNGSNMNLSGKKQIYTPKNTSLLALQYSLPLNKKKEEKISARIEWKQIGTQYFDLGNQIRQLPYSLINLRAGIATPKFELHFWGRNLSNQKYIAYAYDFGAVHLGAPLTYGSTLSIRL